MISTGAMTELLLTTLRSSGLLVGDGVAPTAGGWSAGAPNSGVFTAYSVLAFDGATPAHPEVMGADPEWQTRWSLRHYGGLRDQVDWQSEQVRDLVSGMLKVPFGSTDVFRTIGVLWNSLGAVARNDQVDPPYWQSSDVVMLSVSRVRIPTP